MTLISTYDDIENRIKYHRPDAEGIALIASNRKSAENFAKTILDNCPVGRDTEIALRKVEEALFWANAAIARDSRYQE